MYEAGLHLPVVPAAQWTPESLFCLPESQTTQPSVQLPDDGAVSPHVLMAHGCPSQHQHSSSSGGCSCLVLGAECWMLQLVLAPDPPATRRCFQVQMQAWLPDNAVLVLHV